jgi:uncharacterized protein YceH (UPF0502 family)
MVTMDRTEQRIVGTLIEKQLSVPDSYPLSENALVDGCNQKNNRDPVTELVPFQVAGALMSLQQKGVVARVDGGGRVPRFRHKLDEVLGVAAKDLPILAELLLRGPQAPGALKPRVARMGLHASPEQIESTLRHLAERSPPLVELLPLAPRERDRRWRHLLGDGSEATDGAAAGAAGASLASTVTAAAPAPAPARAVPGDLHERIAALEARVAQLEAELARRGDAAS